MNEVIDNFVYFAVQRFVLHIRRIGEIEENFVENVVCFLLILCLNVLYLLKYFLQKWYNLGDWLFDKGLIFANLVDKRIDLFVLWCCLNWWEFEAQLHNRVIVDEITKTNMLTEYDSHRGYSYRV